MDDNDFDIWWDVKINSCVIILMIAIISGIIWQSSNVRQQCVELGYIKEIKNVNGKGYSCIDDDGIVNKLELMTN